MSSVYADDLPRAEYSPGVRGPLSGLRVIDLSRLVAGNLLTQHLADFGADVIKVEPREGDTLRQWQVEGVSTAWKIYSRGKRSLNIEFRHEKAIALIKRLVKGSAIFIESFRPGTLESMGIGPNVLLAIEPRLVIVRISGWGQDGPYNRKPGFGTLVEGISGFASMNGFADREPVLPPFYLADIVAGLTGASSVLAAVREVEVNGGCGQVIDLPLLDPLFHSLGPHAANFRLTGKVQKRTGSRIFVTAPRNVYRTKDDQWIALSASTQPMAARLFKAMGREDLINDPRFLTNELRVKNNLEIDAIVSDFVGSMNQAEGLAFFDLAEVTVGPIYDVQDFLEDPHVRARGIVANYPDEDVGQFPMHAVTSRLSGTPGAIRSPAPKLGEHTREVLSEFEFTEIEINGLIADGLAKENS